jgi:hypothetical protein
MVTPLIDDPSRTVCKSLPTEVTAMILHSKHRLGGEVVIEATLIRNWDVDDYYTKALFKIDPIKGWLQTSTAKPLVNLIDIDMFGGQDHHPSQPPTQLLMRQTRKEEVKQDVINLMRLCFVIPL